MRSAQTPPSWLASRWSRLVAAAAVIFGLAGVPGEAMRLPPVALAPVAETRLPLSVQVLGVDTARVRLYLLRGEGTELLGDAPLLAGQAEFGAVPRGDIWVLVDAPGKARRTAEFSLDASTTSVEVAMSEGRDLDVMVLDEAGRAVAGAAIEAAADGPIPTRGRTDEKGHALLHGVRMSMAHVEAQKDGSAEGDAWASVSSSAVEVRIRPMAKLHLTVLHENGEPAPGAHIEVVGVRMWPSRVTEAQKDGTADVRGLRTGLLWVRARDGKELSEDVSVEVRAGEQSELKLQLHPGKMVRMQVQDSVGAGIGGARLTVTREGLGPFPDELVADKMGRAEIGPLLAGRVNVRAEADGYVPASESVDADAGDAIMRLERGGRVRVVVKDARGAPIAGARVELAGRDERGMPYERRADDVGFRAALSAVHVRPAAFFPAGELGVVPGPVPPITAAGRSTSATVNGATDSAGVLELDAVPAGEARAHVQHAEFASATSSMLSVHAGSITTLDVVMMRGGTLRGKLVDASGREASGFELRLVGTSPRTTLTDAAGRFEFRNVPERAVVMVQDPQQPTLSLLRAEAEVPEGDTRELMLTLPSEGSPLHVRVLDMQGKPIMMAQVSAVSLDPAHPRRATGFSAPDGYVHLAGFREMESRLDVEAPGYAPRVLYTDKRTTEGVVKLSKGVSLRGRVVSNVGRPVASARIELRQGARVMHALAGADGSFRANSLTAGRISWRVTAAGFTPRSGTSELRVRADGAEAELPDMELVREACVAGVVRDASGHAVAGASVVSGVPHRYRASEGQGDAAASDAGGSFRLCGAGIGRVLLRATAEGRADGPTRTVQLTAGEVTTGVELRAGEMLAPRVREKEQGGVAVTLGEDSQEGAVMVVRVYPGSEAERAGLSSGDIILRVDGASVHSLEEARARLSGGVGDEVVVHVERDGELVAMRVTRELVRR